MLKLGGYDAILGIDWVRQWGEMPSNWDKKYVKLQRNCKWITLQGITNSSQPVVSISATNLRKSYATNDVWAPVLLQSPRPAQDDTEIHLLSRNSPSIKTLLSEYTDVFSSPQSLPQDRQFDHAITILPGAAPVNCRSYRYSPQQKDEIERQVAEMLAAGTVLPSMSPYASPVLLVKKKDGSWRFCVD